MELDKPDFDFAPPADRRPTMPEPPPVRRVAIEDVSLPATQAEIAKLDAFYIGLLRFERDGNASGIVYKAENARLHIRPVADDAPREEMRAMGVEVPSLRDLELLLVHREIPFIKERGIAVGHLKVLLQYPARNWLRLGEMTRIL